VARVFLSYAACQGEKRSIGQCVADVRPTERHGRPRWLIKAREV
jgi:hypothetical protein